MYLLAETEHSCKVCCRGKDGTCTPFILNNGSFLFLRKGKPCTVGFCDEGVSSLVDICSLKPISKLKFTVVTTDYGSFALTGEVYEAGTRCDRTVVGFY